MATTVNKSENASLTTNLAPYAHWLVRAVLAGTFVFHGIDKFANIGIGNFAGAVGIPVGLAGTVAVGEILVGIALFLGGLPIPKADLATRLGGVGMSVIMLGAIMLAHWGRWAFSPSESHPLGGMEYQTLLTLLGVYLAVRGNDL